MGLGTHTILPRNRATLAGRGCFRSAGNVTMIGMPVGQPKIPSIVAASGSRGMESSLDIGISSGFARWYVAKLLNCSLRVAFVSM